MNATKKVFFQILTMSILIGIYSCSSTPSQSDAKKTLEDMINQQSEGKITLAEFKKTNGVKNEIFGQEVYQLEFSYTIEFNQECWKVGNALEGYFSNFKVWDKEPELGFNLFGATTKHFDKGEKMTLKGAYTYEKTENGWRKVKF